MKNQLYVSRMVKSIFNPIKAIGQLVKAHPSYDCHMGKVKASLKLTDDFLVIKQQKMMKKLPFKKIKETSLHEKMWEIRVKVKCDHKVYCFDFPTMKKAKDFYEKIIFNKIQAHRL